MRGDLNFIRKLKKEMETIQIRSIKEAMLVRELHMREYYDEDIDDFNTAFSFVVDYRVLQNDIVKHFWPDIKFLSSASASLFTGGTRKNWRLNKKKLP